MPTTKDITDLTTAMNMALARMAKAFKLNYSTPTNNNQRISSNPRNRQIGQPCMNMGQDRQMQMVGLQNVGNQVIQDAAQNLRLHNIGNQNGLIGVPGNVNQNLNGNGNLVAARAEGNAPGHNGNQIRCYNCRGVGHFSRNYTVRPRRRDVAYLQTQLLIAQKEEAGIQLQAEEIQEKKAKLFNEWERFTSKDGESIESYYHHFLKLMNDLNRNKHFPEKIVSNLKFLNNLQPEWSRHVTIVHQTKDLHTADYTQFYDFLKYNQKAPEWSRHVTIVHQTKDLHTADYTQLYDFLKYNQKENYLQQPMPNLEDIIDPTTAMNMALSLMAKAFKLNYSTPTNNNQRISSNPRNRQIAQPGMNMGQDRQMQMIGGNGRNQFRQYAGQNAGNLNGYNAVQNIRNQVAQNLRVQNVGNQNGLIGVQGNGNQNQIGNGIGGNGGNQFRQYVGQHAGNLNGYNAVHNVRNQVAQNPRVQNVGNQNGPIGVQGNGNQNQIGNGNLVAVRAEENAAGHNGSQI
nr:hypothetical protein [Tanacetum cinerariifolium]